MKPKQKQAKARQTSPKISLEEKWKKSLHSKLLQFALLTVISISYFNNYIQLFDQKIDQNGDNIHYYSLGKALSEGKGYTNTMGFKESAHTHFPPGYPVFIAGIMKFAPNSINAIKTTNGFLLFLSIIILFFLLKRISGNVIVSFITCWLAASQPELLRWASLMMSEMLYLFLSISALCITVELTERRLLKDKKWFFYTLIASLLLLVNAIYFVRTMGVAVILAIMAWITIVCIQNGIAWWKSRKNTESLDKKGYFIKYGIIVLLITLTVFTSKSLWGKRNTDLGARESAYIENFYMKMYGERMETAQDWQDRIVYNISNYTAKWIPNTLFYTTYDVKQAITNTEWLRGIITLLLMIAGVIFLRKWRWIILFYILATMSVLLVYPEQYGGSRYYLALIPIFIFILLNGVYELAKLASKKQKLAWMISAIVSIAFAAVFIFPKYNLMRKQISKETSVADWKYTNYYGFAYYIEAAEWCSTNLDKSARVLCRKPELFYMYSGYRQAEMFPQYASPDSVLKVFREKKITHIIIDSWFRHAYATIYPAIKANEEKFKMVQQISKTDNSNNLLPTLVVEFNDEWGFKGQRINGKIEGQGEWVYQNWYKYIGKFANKLPNGYGEYYDDKGKLVGCGIWKDGQLIKPQARKN